MYDDDIESQIEEAKDLFDKGYIFCGQGDTDKGIACYDSLIARYATSDIPDMQDEVCNVMFVLARALNKRNDVDGAIAAYDSLVKDFACCNSVEIAILVGRSHEAANALRNKRFHWNRLFFITIILIMRIVYEFTKA